MGGGTQKTKTENRPWDGVAPQMANAANQIGWTYENLFNNLPTSAYTQQSTDALAGQVNNQGSLLNQSLGLAGKTVNGDFLGANPYVQQAYQGAADQATRAYSSAVDPSMRQYQSQMTGNLQNYQSSLENNMSQWQNAISPGIDAQFAMGGRLGSGLFANARNEGETNVARQFSDAQSDMARSFGDAQSNQAQYLADSNDALARNLTNTAGQMYYQNYSDERGRQNAAMTAAPGMATLPGGILQQIGEQQKAENPYAQKFNIAQQYAQSAGGLNGGLGTMTQKAPGGNPWLQALGLGMQGAAMFV